MFSSFGSTTTTSYSSLSSNDDIKVYIITNNIQKIKEKINNKNVNNIIDRSNNYTALHYAVTLSNNEITEYLLTCGADASVKDKEGNDCYSLSRNKFLHNLLIKRKEDKIYELQLRNDELKNKIRELEERNDYLNKNADDYILKVVKITSELTEKKEEVIALKSIISKHENEVNALKRKLEDSDTAFTNLLKRQRKN